MKKPANDQETIKAMIAWLEGYPKFRGVMVLFDPSDNTITDLSNVELGEIVNFATIYKNFIDQKAGVQQLPDITQFMRGFPPGVPIMIDEMPDEDIEMHTHSHTCPCSVAELEDVRKYASDPAHTLAGLLEMVNHRLAKSKGEA